MISLLLAGRWSGLGALLVLGGVTACSDSTAPASSGPLTGRWKTQAGFSFPIDVTLTQTDTIVEGRGTMAATPPRLVIVVGHYSSSLTAPNRVILPFAGVNTIPAIFFANLSLNQDSLSGDYRWTSGLSAEPATFIRQP